MFLPMTVVITASTDKEHNSVITVKDQSGLKTVELPMPDSQADDSPDQAEEQAIIQHLPSPATLDLGPNIEAPDPLAVFAEHDDKQSTQEDDKPSALVQADKPFAPVQADDRSPALAPFPAPSTMNVDIDETLLAPSTRLQHYLKNTDELLVCPGVYDGFSARIAISVGYKAMYMTGAGTTASRLGMADLGIAQLHDMREHAEMIANLDPKRTTLIADMDTGYGGPLVITNAVNQYIRAGVAGFHLEDQIQNKRCGHLQGKEVVDLETYLCRIRAAKAAKDAAGSDIVLIARTDANQKLGYDECITRLKAARDIGADVGLLEGFKTKAEAKQAVVDLAPWPLLLNIVENGASPRITVAEAKEMGFRIMIFSLAALAPAYLAIKGAFETLMNEGVTKTDKALTPKVLFNVCGLQDAMLIDANSGGTAFAGGV